MRGGARGCHGPVSCGDEDEEPGVDEPAREGLAIDVAGVDYNVFLTRAAQPRDPARQGLLRGRAGAAWQRALRRLPPGLQPRRRPVRTATNFKVEDNQGNEFEPIELPEDNAFAYHARELGKDDCIPEDGSVAQLGPTAGSMLLFQFPLETTENRPLELVIERALETKRVELDL